MQTEKDVKEPNSAPPRGVLSIQGAHSEMSQIAWTQNLPLLVPTYTKVCQNIRFGEYPRKNFIKLLII